MSEQRFSVDGCDPPAFVDRVLDEADRLGASDIYWLPEADAVAVRIRVHGAQREVARLPREFGETCVTRIKVLAGLLTYRKLVAQDGAIHRPPHAEIRVSLIPTSHGERAALRLLPGARRQPALDELGFPPDITRLLRQMLDAPTGLIVLTGPTGSGKTTTIYALIQEILRRQQDPASILTLEDPIERVLDGVSQTAVAVDREWDYTAALRAALRQDVKTIVVGEMRDRAIVGLTLDAALTGHRVITTYHAGDIPSVYARMLHQGFEPFLIASALTGVVTQRLVPRTDGRGSYPIIAAIAPDDEWRDFVISNPGLAALRREIRRHPQADLAAAAHRLSNDESLPPADQARLRSWSAT
jgi:type II secretory ATPase GspE/PulE/Tfp pilus assembly ATPase PilB-like protein